jgi:N-acetylmuramoyl-L-alanine amidase
VKRVQAGGKRQARRGAAAAAATTPANSAHKRVARPARSQLPAFDAPRWGRWFAIGLGAIAIAALIVFGGQSVPNWLATSRLGATVPAPDSPAANAAGGRAAAADPNRIGIVSGHRNNDSGTVCSDGLTEASVNFDHAVRVADLLRSEGYTVDILDEFDVSLKDYRALALLSIHADSCTYINELATGFKVARAQESRVPALEDRLVACLTSRYRSATGLRFHANTVTYDMTKYHAFYEIAPETPAAIIETGFLYLDRPILTGQPERIARGIADGLLCFLWEQAP